MHDECDFQPYYVLPAAEDYQEDWDASDDELDYGVPDDWVAVPPGAVEGVYAIQWQYRSRIARRLLILVSEIDFRLQMMTGRHAQS